MVNAKDRQTNKANVSTGLKGEVCDNYCKFPELYQNEYGSSGEACKLLHERVCSECPLNKL